MPPEMRHCWSGEMPAASKHQIESVIRLTRFDRFWNGSLSILGAIPASIPCPTMPKAVQRNQIQ
eukprot:5656443-Karenia_brevis.AAC.1